MGLVILVYELTSCRGHARSAVPGSAGILPATGRRPAIVHAGKMPALPGKRRRNDDGASRCPGPSRFSSVKMKHGILIGPGVFDRRRCHGRRWRDGTRLRRSIAMSLTFGGLLRGSDRTTRSAERRAPSAERRAPSAERRAHECAVANKVHPQRFGCGAVEGSPPAARSSRPRASLPAEGKRSDPFSARGEWSRQLRTRGRHQAAQCRPQRCVCSPPLGRSIAADARNACDRSGPHPSPDNHRAREQ